MVIDEAPTPPKYLPLEAPLKVKVPAVLEPIRTLKVVALVVPDVI